MTALQSLKTLAKDSVIYGIAGALLRSMSALLVPVFSREFSPSEYGALSIVLAFGAAFLLRISHETLPLLREIPSVPWRMAAHAGWCIAKGSLQALAMVLLDRAAAVDGLRLVALGVGRLAGLGGYRYEEYRRIHGR